jgi:hypothetical protein
MPSDDLVKQFVVCYTEIFVWLILALADLRTSLIADTSAITLTLATQGSVAAEGIGSA